MKPASNMVSLLLNQQNKLNEDSNRPRYSLWTTSRILKKIDVDEEDILKFKSSFIDNRRKVQTSHTNRNNKLRSNGMYSTFIFCGQIIKDSTPTDQKTSHNTCMKSKEHDNYISPQQNSKPASRNGARSNTVKSIDGRDTLTPEWKINTANQEYFHMQK